MIQKWGVQNFKSIKEASLELAPLTIFTGTNSSGKSSFLQSILVLKQTLEASEKTKVLVPNGPLVTLGELRDILSESDAKEKNNHITFDAVFSKYLTKDEKDSFESSLQRISGGTIPFKIIYHHIKLTIDTKTGLLDELHLSNNSSGVCFRKNKNHFDITIEEEKGEKKKHKNCDIQSDHFFPEKVARTELFPSSYAFWAEVIVKLLKNEDIPYYPYTSRHGIGIYYYAISDSQNNNNLSRSYGPEGNHSDYDHHFIPWTVIDFVETVLKDILDFSDVFRATGKIQKLPIYGGSRDKQSHLELLNYGDWKTTIKCLDSGVQRKIKERLTQEKNLTEKIEELIRKSEELIQKNLKEFPEPGLERFMLLEEKKEFEAVKRIDLLSNGIYTAADQIKNQLKNIRYIGPLREKKAIYPPATGCFDDDVGKEGENMSFVYELYKDKNVTYFDPCSNFTESKTEPLADAVSFWLQYLSIAWSFETSIVPNSGGHIMALVKTSKEGRPRTLDNVGTGISQVLAILVQGLILKSEVIWGDMQRDQPMNIFIVEQPELHLHSKAQARLADFFISVTRPCGEALPYQYRQVLIETHSEHIANRLWYRIASAAPPLDQQLVDSSSVYFAKKEDGVSQFTLLKPDRFSAMSEWPEDFFDTAQLETEAILDAMSRKLQEDSRDE